MAKDKFEEHELGNFIHPRQFDEVRLDKKEDVINFPVPNRQKTHFADWGDQFLAKLRDGDLQAQGESSIPENADASITVDMTDFEAQGETFSAKDRLVGEFTRKAFVPSMQPVATELFKFARNISKKDNYGKLNNIMYVESPAGYGKSEGPRAFCDALGYEFKPLRSGAVKGDFDRMLINDLFGGKPPKSPMDRIDAVLQSNDPTLTETQQALTTALSGKEILDKDGKCINRQKAAEISGQDGVELNEWVVALANAQLPPEATGGQFLRREDGPLMALFKEIKAEYDAAKADQAAERTNIKNETGSAPKGRPPRVTVKPRIIMIDEYNRYNPGKEFQDFFELMGGKTDKTEITFEDAQGTSITLPRDALRNVYFYMNGNPHIDKEGGVEGVHDLSNREDFISRVKYVELDPKSFGAKDYQTRFEQQLAGVPIQAVLDAGRDYDKAGKIEFDYWEQKGSNLSEFLKTRRTLALTNAQKAVMRANEATQVPLLEDPYSTAVAMEELSKFLVNISALEKNPSAFFDTADKGDDSFLGQAAPDLDQVEAALGSKAPIFNPRTISDIIADAKDERIIRGAKAPSLTQPNRLQLNMKAADAREPIYENSTPSNFGTRLCQGIMHKIDERYQQGPVREIMFKLMYFHGIIDKDALSADAAHHEYNIDRLGDRPVSVFQSLNVDAMSKYKNEQAWQKAMGEMVKARFGNSKEYGEQLAGVDVSQIIPHEAVIGTLKALETYETELNSPGKAEEKAALDAKLPKGFMPFITLQAHAHEGSWKVAPRNTVLVDAITRKEQLGNKDTERNAVVTAIDGMKKNAGSLTTTQELLVSLAAFEHEMSANQIEHMFNKDNMHRAFEAGIAGAIVDAREKNLKNADDKNKARLEGDLEKAKETKGLTDKALTDADVPSHQEAWLKDAEDIAEHQNHPSNVGVTTLHTQGYDATNNKYFDDDLTVITVGYEKDGLQATKTLIVGFSPVGDSIKELLADKNITYVDANAAQKDETTRNQIASELKTIMAEGRANIRKNASDETQAHGDLDEKSNGGLLFHLEQAMNIRTPDAYVGEGKEGDSLNDKRVDSIVNHLISDKSRSHFVEGKGDENHVNPIHATTSSGSFWTGKMTKNEANKVTETLASTDEELRSL